MKILQIANSVPNFSSYTHKVALSHPKCEKEPILNQAQKSPSIAQHYRLPYLFNALNVIRRPFYQGIGSAQFKQGYIQEKEQILQELGGTSYMLKNKFSNIQTTFLSLEAFAQKLSAASATYVSFSIPQIHNKRNDTQKMMSGIRLSLQQSEQLVHALIQTGVLNNKESVLQWKIVKDAAKDAVYLVSAQDFFALQAAKHIDSSGNIRAASQSLPLDVIVGKQITVNKAASTVVLCGGIKTERLHSSVMQEAAHLLLQGVNVMLFDYRGSGQSQGFITEQGIDDDLDKVCHHLMQNKNITKEQIILKGNCFGGGPATRCAARHPGMHLILDQTYADSKELAEQIILGKTASAQAKEKKNNQNTLCQKICNIARKALHSLYLPDDRDVQAALFASNGFHYNVSEDLQNIQGRICLITNSNDGLIDHTHDVRNIAAAKSSTECTGYRLTQLTLSGIPHGHGWFEKGDVDMALDANFISKVPHRKSLNKTTLTSQEIMELENHRVRVGLKEFLHWVKRDESILSAESEAYKKAFVSVDYNPAPAA